MFGGEAGDAFPLPSPPCCAPQARLKRLRELEADGVVELRQKVTPQRLPQAGGRTFIPWLREVARVAPKPLEERQTPSPPRQRCLEEHRPSLHPRGGIKIVEGRELHLPCNTPNYTVLVYYSLEV